MPVTGSKRVLKWATVHDGVMRRSEDELAETMSSGTSTAVWGKAMVCSDGFRAMDAGRDGERVRSFRLGGDLEEVVWRDDDGVGRLCRCSMPLFRRAVRCFSTGRVTLLPPALGSQSCMVLEAREKGG
jgi:hypothetical protein